MREQAGLAEVAEPQRVARHDPGASTNVHGRFEQHDAAVDLAEACVGTSEVARHGGQPVVEVVAPAELEGALEWRDRLPRLPLADVRRAEACQRRDQCKWALARFAESHGLSTARF